MVETAYVILLQIAWVVLFAVLLVRFRRGVVQSARRSEHIALLLIGLSALLVRLVLATGGPGNAWLSQTTDCAEWGHDRIYGCANNALVCLLLLFVPPSFDLLIGINLLSTRKRIWFGPWNPTRQKNTRSTCTRPTSYKPSPCGFSPMFILMTTNGRNLRNYSSRLSSLR